MMERIVQETQDLLGFALTDSQVAALAHFRHELQVWNKRHNLTAIRDPEKVRVKHFLDSLSCLLAMRGAPIGRVIDIGTGAGFPGLPLKIVCPSMRLTLVDSIGKKMDFCRHIVKSLQLEGVEVLQARAEQVGRMPGYREKFDWAIARSVANMPVLMEYLLPLVRVEGCALAQKGETGPAEAQSAENALRLLGGQLRQIIPVTLPGVPDQRYLLVVDKIAATPENLPRRVGIPAKRPL